MLSFKVSLFIQFIPSLEGELFFWFVWALKKKNRLPPNYALWSLVLYYNLS